MTLLYILYTVLTTIIFVLVFPFALIYAKITGKYSDHLKERLGRIPAPSPGKLQGGPRIWIHAVSLGEVRVADAVITALKKRIPGCFILLSTTTRHGRDLAESLDHGNIQVVYLPLDTFFCIRPALSMLRPDILVFVETEIWPGWIFEAWQKGIKTAMVNGRISPRSFKSYLRLKPLLKHVLKRFHVFSMIRPEDGQRIISLGAPRERVKINGNAKYKKIPESLDPEAEDKMRKTLDLPGDARVIVAGSTREGEEEMVLDAYERVLETFPETFLILAPRHIQRAGAIGAMLSKRGYDCTYRTRLKNGKSARKPGIIIIDTFGELFNTYSVATVVFCGASLVPLGGQNPLEPAAWGKPVLYGPSMEDFLDAKEMLEAEGGGITVADASGLAEEILWLFETPRRLYSMGENAKTAVFAHSSAADSHAEEIEKLLTDY